MSPQALPFPGPIYARAEALTSPPAPARRKRREQRLQRTNLAMIALTLLMYFMGTIHVALALRVDLIAFFDQHAIEGGVTIFDDQGDRLVWLQIMIELLNVSIPLTYCRAHAAHPHFAVWSERTFMSVRTCANERPRYGSA